MANEFEGFQRPPLRTMQGTWEVGTETARLVEIGLANLELSFHINAKLNRIEERLTLMETQDTQLLAIDKSLVTDFATLGTNVTAILAKLNSSPVATTDPIVAAVIGGHRRSRHARHRRPGAQHAACGRTACRADSSRHHRRHRSERSRSLTSNPVPAQDITGLSTPPEGITKI